MFDNDLLICGACGVDKLRHAERCASADLQRVADLEREVDDAFGALARSAGLRQDGETASRNVS